MSHVDEGTLHAYLDGELTPVEQEKVDTHLKGCPACQARLAEERALIERASRLLGAAAPPERGVPPFQELRQPQLVWRLRRPLAWAATVVLAIGLGWVARGTLLQNRAIATVAEEKDTRAEPTVAPSTAAPPKAAALAIGQSRQEQKRADSESQFRQQALADRDVGPSRAADAASNTLALQAKPSVRESQDSAKLDAVGPLAHNEPAISIRGRAAGGRAVPAAPQPQPAATPAAAEAVNGTVFVDGAIVRRAPALLTTEWPLISRKPARDVLGVEPVVIPGFAISGYRRNPAAREIVVEQVTNAGTAISLIERRVDDAVSAEFGGAGSTAATAPRAAAKAVNERLARFVGPLRVEIYGPLTPDSLNSLLELAR